MNSSVVIKISAYTDTNHYPAEETNMRTSGKILIPGEWLLGEGSSFNANNPASGQ
jgi:hypothetical protein